MNQVIELPVSEFKMALTGLAKIINGRSSLPVLGCVRLEPQPDGMLSLQATDLDSFATCRTKATTMTEFPVCITPIEPIIKILKGTKDRISLVDGEKGLCLRYQVGSAAILYPLDMIPIDQWPAVPDIKATPFAVEPTFKQALREAMECSSTESTRHIINGICLDVSQADCHCLVATDGRHLYAANTFQFPTPDSVIIPNRKFLSWSGLHEDGNWSVAVEPPGMKDKEVGTPAHVQIQSEHWTFVTKGIEGTYPNWRQVMPGSERQFTTVKLTDEAVGQVLDALPRMPGNDEVNQPVTCLMGPGRLVLRTRARQAEEWTEVPVHGVSVTGPDQRVCLNRTFMTKALRFGFAEFQVQDGFCPILFTGPGKKMVAMPMRLEGDSPTAQAVPQPTQSCPQEAAQPTEAAPPVPRPPVEPENQKEQNTTMNTNIITTLPTPQRGNVKPISGSNGETSNTAMKAVVETVERIKTNLRDMISELNDALSLLKAAEKENKASLKEVESVRATLRSLQKVEL